MPGSVSLLLTQEKKVGDPNHASATADLSCAAFQPSGALQKDLETIPMGLRPLHIFALAFCQPFLLPAPLTDRKILQEVKPQILSWNGLRAWPRGVGSARREMPSQGCGVTAMKEKQKENRMSLETPQKSTWL